MPLRLPTILLALLLGVGASAQNLSRVRLSTPDPAGLAQILQSAGFDVLLTASESDLDLVVSAPEWAALTALGLSPVLVEVGQPFSLIQAAAAAGDGGLGVYPDLASVEASLAATAAAYPAITRLVDLTQEFALPATALGRHLFALVISDNPQATEDEPGFLMVAGHHAREIVTPVLALDAVSRLTTGYGVDPQITALVNGYEIWVLPCANPDGYDHVFTQDNLWRKNRRPFANGTGVDLNRNYPIGWSGPCPGSTQVSSETYKGPSPASESEVQSIMALSTARRFARVLDYHSYGREFLWAYQCLPHPFELFLQSEAQQLSTLAGWGGAERRPTNDGEEQEWQLGRGAFAFLAETHTTFQPLYASALNEAAALWPAVLALLERPSSVVGHVKDAQTLAPLSVSIEVLELPFANGESGFSSGGNFGRYDLVLPDGSWTLRFSAPGYLTQTLPVTVSSLLGATALEVLLQALTPDSGQPNSTGARLDVAGALDQGGNAPQAFQNGPFFRDYAPGDDVVLDFSGDPGRAFVLFSGPLHRNNAVFAGIGSLDLGLMGAQSDFSDLVVALNGLGGGFLDQLAVLDGQGSQTLSFTVPGLPPGTTLSLQALVYRSAGLPVLTAATRLTVP